MLIDINSDNFFAIIRMIRVDRASFCIVIIIFLVSVGCSQPITPPTIVRNFTTSDLLISLSDLPDGWKVKWGPEDITEKNELYADEASSITFVANTDTYGDILGSAVFRFNNPKIVQDIYFDNYEGYGWIPEEWNQPPISATLSTIGCVSRPSSANIDCSWAAQYDEFIVEIIVNIIPNYMSLDDLERLVQVVDTKMVKYLK